MARNTKNDVKVGDYIRILVDHTNNSSRFKRGDHVEVYKIRNKNAPHYCEEMAIAVKHPEENNETDPGARCDWLPKNTFHKGAQVWRPTKYSKMKKEVKEEHGRWLIIRMDRTVIDTYNKEDLADYIIENEGLIIDVVEVKKSINYKIVKSKPTVQFL